MKYLIKFDENGRRGTTYAESVHFIDQGGALIGIGNINPDACLKSGFVLVKDEEYQLLLGNGGKGEHIYKDGRFIPAPPPVRDIEEVRSAVLEQVRQETAEHITGGFISGGVRYDSDMDTQITMQGICLSVDSDRFKEEYPQGAPVRGYDSGSDVKTVHWLDGDGVKAFCADMSQHIGNCKKIGWKLQKAAETADSIEALEAIKWPETES